MMMMIDDDDGESSVHCQGTRCGGNIGVLSEKKNGRRK